MLNQLVLVGNLVKCPELCINNEEEAYSIELSVNSYISEGNYSVILTPEMAKQIKLSNLNSIVGVKGFIEQANEISSNGINIVRIKAMSISILNSKK